MDNEWLCSLLLEAFGLPVPRSHPLLFEGQKVLAVERFDRRWAMHGSRSWLQRLPQEDMCQATGTPARAKYEAEGGPGIDRILEVLNGSSQRLHDRENFFKAQLMFWMLCAPDGHAKNFSIALHAGGAYSLTPFYDVKFAYPVLGKGSRQLSSHKVKKAMALRSKITHWRMREILGRHWLELGQRHGIVSESGLRATHLIEQMADRTPSAIELVSAKLPKDFPSQISSSIFEGLDRAARLLRSWVLLSPVDWCGRCRPHARHLNDDFFTLGTIVVNLIAIVHYIASSRRGHRALGVKFLAGAHPPSTGDHCEKTVMRMKVRATHIAGKPFQANHIDTRLRGVAE